MTWLLKQLGIEDATDMLLKSAFTKLVFLALVAGAAFWLFGKKLSSSFWIGFAAAALAATYVMTQIVNPIEGDPVFQGTINDTVYNPAGQGFTTNRYHDLLLSKL